MGKGHSPLRRRHETVTQLPHSPALAASARGNFSFGISYSSNTLEYSYQNLDLMARKKFRSQNKTVQVDLKISRSFCNVKYHKQKLN